MGTIVQMAAFIGIRMIGTLMDGNIVVIIEVITIRENGKAVCRIRINTTFSTLDR